MFKWYCQTRIKTSYLQGILKNIVKKVFSFMGGEKHRGKQRLGITKTEIEIAYIGNKIVALQENNHQ